MLQCRIDLLMRCERERDAREKTGAAIMKHPRGAFNWKSEINMLMYIRPGHWQGYLWVTVSAIATLTCRQALCFLIKQPRFISLSSVWWQVNQKQSYLDNAILASLIEGWCSICPCKHYEYTMQSLMFGLDLYNFHFLYCALNNMIKIEMKSKQQDVHLSLDSPVTLISVCTGYIQRMLKKKTGV